MIKESDTVRYFFTASLFLVFAGVLLIATFCL